MPNQLIFGGAWRVAVLFIALTSLGRAAPETPAETPEARAARLEWFHEAKFGMFIHWGLYSIPAGTWKGKQVEGIGEWIMNKGKIPMKDYEALAGQFNPVKFNAEAWVKAAKGAGMKYIVITSKHHDGFAMFKSEASAFNIVDATPYHHDPLKDLAAACAKEGIKLGFYYSQAQDWNHPGGSARGGFWDPAQNGDMDLYLRTVAVPQVREILTHYGPIAVLWWDTPDRMTPERAALLAPLLKLQPGIITNNRLGGGYHGDTETPEQRIPATGYPGDWESCMTMNDTWGFKSYDHNWKSTETLVRNLIDIVSKGGNYLLNVGPTSEGLMPEASLERLQQIGAWLRQNGEAIYGATASPFLRLGWGRATQKPGKLYLHVFTWPKDGTLVVPMRSGATHAYLLSAPDKSLALKSTPAGLRVSLPAKAPDKIASVVVLEGVGTVDALPPPLLRPGKDDVLTLACDDGVLTGKSLRVEGNLLADLTDWTATDDAVSWHPEIVTPGKYTVTINCQVPAGAGGSDYVVSVGTQKLSGQTTETGEAYKDLAVGSIQIDQAGPVVITVRATHIAHEAFAKFRSLTLRPVPVAAR